MRCAVLLLVIVGCYEAPDYSGTRFKCDVDHPCPEGQLCSSGFCTETMTSDGGRNDGSPRDSSMIDTAPGGAGVLCGSIVCGSQQKCCADFAAGPSCVALGAGCNGYAATCDGTEDCAGIPCCDVGGQMIQCATSCPTLTICREPADCTNPQLPYCCFGTGFNEPWGRCLNGCI